MKNITRFTGLLLAAVIMTVAFTSESQAMPAFARQTGFACSTCHFQQFPLLNAFGRSFKISGFTMMGTEGKIEGEDLSIPATLNASLVTKIRYQKENGHPAQGTNSGQVQFPDEAALLLGGRAGEHIGFLLETQLKDPTLPAFATFKMPIGYEVGGVHLEAIPYTTDSLGASVAFELLNTGAVRHIRPTEHRKEVSAQQYVGLDGIATGIAFVAANDMGFVNLSLYEPRQGTADVGTSFLNYIRVAATPQVAGWDLGVGAQLYTGSSKGQVYVAQYGIDEVKANAMALDAQAQGAVGSMPLGVYLSYAIAPKSDATGAKNIYNGSTTDDKSATAISALLGVLPKTELSLGYRLGNNGKSDNGMAIGVQYLLAQNVQLSLNHSIKNGDAINTGAGDADQQTTLMLFSAF